MEDHNQTSFTFVVDNLSSEKKISSPTFLIGGWEWYVDVYTKDEDHYFDIDLLVANDQSLRPGLVKRVSISFVKLNQSGKEIYRIKETSVLLGDKVIGWGGSLPLEEGEKNKLILKVELVKVVEVVDWNDQMFDVLGFQVHYSQAISVNSLYKHPDFAINFRLTNQLVKTTYMKLLLSLIDTLEEPRHSLTEIELSNARSDLVELTEAGFKLDWLKEMLDDEVSLERNNSIADVSSSSSSRVDEQYINDGSSSSRVEEQYIKEKEKVKDARDWLEGLVHSWKGSLGFAHHHLRNNKKTD